jgi:hypothetical protein
MHSDATRIAAIAKRAQKERTEENDPPRKADLTAGNASVLFTATALD